MYGNKSFTQHGPAINTAWDVNNDVFVKKPISSPVEFVIVDNEKKNLAAEPETESSSSTCCGDVSGFKYIGGSDISTFRR